MDSVWREIDRLVRDPPIVILVVIGAILVSHVLHAILRFAGLWKDRDDGMTIIIEVLITLVLAVLTMKAYFIGSMTPTVHSNEGAYLLCGLIAFGVLSMVLYWLFHRR